MISLTVTELKECGSAAFAFPILHQVLLIYLVIRLFKPLQSAGKNKKNVVFRVTYSKRLGRIFGDFLMIVHNIKLVHL